MAQYHTCELCNRNVSVITKHHLIPLEKGGKKLDTIHLCPTCHTAIHSLFTNRELASRFNSLELIKRDIKIIKYLKFIENVPGDSFVPIKKSRRVRKSS
ncbi:HNH endonuclease [uncultured Clostridium sp.]|mgnify:FL=1|uniref:HNH endonuclease n=1 Tax=uncultured Clostridium sp. TaxID=59620 RepID=UPI0025DF4A3C|nr:HNH endonuclease [uncultured Clostridium sp.]